MTDRDAPIGVFDSGLGGLTVVRELIRQLPNESIIYFGDTARVPYGPKGPNTVVRYSQDVAAFLRTQGVKAIVVACNTATAHALPTLVAEQSVPVIGVIEPGSRAAVRVSRDGRIGVIGTRGTVRSLAYDKAIMRLAPRATVTTAACPLFVPLIEEGWLDSEPTRIVARGYLEPFTDGRIDTLVLGCTHYPLLKTIIGQTVGRDVRLIDSAEETAAETARVLRENELEATGSNAHYRFVASDDPEQFLAVGQRFLGAPLERVELVTLGG
ncbi:MAG: glutamate racemase [Gemmatimonadaceae bacterium]